jgi:hypothetical protein
VRKTVLPIVLAASLTLSLALAPVVKAGSNNAHLTTSVKEIVTSSSNSAMAATTTISVLASSLYNDLDLSALGLSYDAMEYAYKGYEFLKAKGRLGNSNILTVVDFSQSSKKKRMYIIDVTDRKILLNTYVAHGKNTGLDYATRFSNKMESLQSSLGFYVTKGTYFGKHGLSLKLDGQEPGFNDKAEQRAVVVHGADYIGAHRIDAAYMGRSFGCPAVPQAQSNTVINLLKNGTTLFIYHPSNSYLQGSKILNG